MTPLVWLMTPPHPCCSPTDKSVRLSNFQLRIYPKGSEVCWRGWDLYLIVNIYLTIRCVPDKVRGLYIIFLSPWQEDVWRENRDGISIIYEMQTCEFQINLVIRCLPKVVRNLLDICKNMNRQIDYWMVKLKKINKHTYMCIYVLTYIYTNIHTSFPICFT